MLSLHRAIEDKVSETADAGISGDNRGVGRFAAATPAPAPASAAQLPAAGAAQVNVPPSTTQQGVSDVGRRWVVHNSLSYSQSTGVLRTMPQPASDITVSGRSNLPLGASRSTTAMQSNTAGGIAAAGDAESAMGTAALGTHASASRSRTMAFAGNSAANNGPVNGAAVMAHNAHNEVVIDRLSMEVTSMAQQLDDSKRENELQRREIARLKRVMMKSANPSLPSPTNAAAAAFRARGMFGAESRSPSPDQDLGNYNSEIANLSLEDSANNNQESSIVVGLRHAVKVDRSLTHADSTGRPSASDYKDLALMPIHSNIDHPNARRGVRSSVCNDVHILCYG